MKSKASSFVPGLGTENKLTNKESAIDSPSEDKKEYFTAPGLVIQEAKSLKNKLAELTDLYNKQQKQIEESVAVVEINLTEIIEDETSEYGSLKRTKDSDAYQSLKASIKEVGLLEPIEVNQIEGAGGKILYTIISGHHRVLIYKELGRESIPCRILPKAYATDRASVIFRRAFYSNLHQEGLCPFEIFEGLHKLQKIDGLQAKELMEQTGFSHSSYYRYMSYASLTPKSIELIRQKPTLFSVNQAEMLHKIVNADPDKAKEIEKLIPEMLYGKPKLTFEKMLETLTGDKIIKNTHTRPGSKEEICKVVRKRNTVSVKTADPKLGELIEKTISEYLASLEKE